MATLQETKQRKISVQKTRKITKAMQLVATAKIRHARKNLEAIQEYYTAVYSTFKKLLTNVRDFKRIFPTEQADRKVIIMITSDLGLCGAYNANILKLHRKEHRPGDFTIVLGSKGSLYTMSKGLTDVEMHPNIGDKVDYMIPNRIAERVINLFMTGQINRVLLLYTRYVNSISFVATQAQLLPTDPTDVQLEREAETVTIMENIPRHLISFEPSPELVLKTSLPLYISALIYGTTIESKLSEMSSRRTAMENATDNADELIDKLNLIFNRARQAKITQEISEIVAGAESL